MTGINPQPGYHLTTIRSGAVGTSSKLMEEVEELIDAESQGCKLMALVELSDLVGAIKLYLAANYPAFQLCDLEVMADITARAFRNGHR